MHILWIKTEFLHPVDKGGRIRTYQMLRALRRQHRITYVALDDDTAAPGAQDLATEYAHEVVRVPFSPARKGSLAFYLELVRNVLSPLPYAVERYRSAELNRRIRSICADNGVDVVVCDFLAPSLNVPQGLGVPTILFQHNVESMIWERHSLFASNPIRRSYMTRQWKRMLRHERAECQRFDHVIAVSKEDAKIFAEQFDVHQPSSVPTGVDTEYFQPSPRSVRNRHELVFTGSMDWIPNEDAIRWFIQDILPRIRARVPDVSITIVGRHPSAAIRALAVDDGSITVTGSVPDVRPYMERASVFVVPIRIGGGTRLKIFEAMAMECPVVSTTVGAEGLPLRAGVDVVLADAPASFADAVSDLLLHPNRARALAAAAAEQVRTHYGWSRVATLFAELCAAEVDRAAVAGDIPGRAGAISNHQK